MCNTPKVHYVYLFQFHLQRHLNSAHTLEDKTIAQTRVQLQIVNQLDLQLQKEKDRLDAMMKHLQLEVTKSGDIRPITKISPQSPLDIISSRMKEGKGDLVDFPARSTQQHFPSQQTSTPSHLNLLQTSIEKVRINVKNDICNIEQYFISYTRRAFLFYDFLRLVQSTFLQPLTTTSIITYLKVSLREPICH